MCSNDVFVYALHMAASLAEPPHKRGCLFYSNRRKWSICRGTLDSSTHDAPASSGQRDDVCATESE